MKITRHQLLSLAATFTIIAGCSSNKTSGSGSGGNGGNGGGGHTSSSTTTTGSHMGGGTSQSSTSSTGSGPDSCAGVTCSGHGTCAVASGQAVCTCQGGYHAVGLTCVADETCAGKNCGNCGTCMVMGGVATCMCPDGYSDQGNGCALATDPCATANCQADEACVPEAHCQPLGACVKTCDCSNCPSCTPDNSDGKWNDWQQYCGPDPTQTTATMACNKPCPAGEGCLPYAQQICWPIEGCFSL